MLGLAVPWIVAAHSCTRLTRGKQYRANLQTLGTVPRAPGGQGTLRASSPPVVTWLDLERPPRRLDSRCQALRRVT